MPARAADAGAEDSWLLWLDLWAQSPRNPAVAAIRQKIDERWRETIRTLVLTGQEAGEFAAVDADGFAVALSALLYGFVVPIALDDPAVGPARAFELTMQFASGRLGFGWNGRRASNRAGGGTVAGGRIELVALTKRFHEVAVDGSTWTSPAASSSPCSGRPAAARPPRCG